MTKYSNSLVIVVVGMLSCAALSAYAQNNIQPVQSLTVVDANGRKVGNVLSLGGDGNQTPIFNVVAFKAHKNLLILGVVSHGFLGTDSQLFFTSFECSGTPSFSATATFPAPFPDTARRTAVVGNKVFAPAGTTSETLNINSVLTSLNVPGSSSCLQASFPFDVLPSQVVVDLGSQFSVPFSVVATPTQN